MARTPRGHQRPQQEVTPPMIFSVHNTPNVNRSAEALAEALACGQPSCSCGKRQGKEWRTHCPCHDDAHPSLDIADGDGGKPLLKCRAGCQQDAVIGALRARGLWPGLNDNHRHEEPEASYDYCDGAGRLLSQVIRYPHKKFKQRRPDGSGGWVWNLDNARRVPYRLPELLAAPRDAWLYIPEGEKDVDRLVALNLVATTNPGGAGKWRQDFGPHFEGRRIAILPDNDDPGRRHSQQVAQSLAPYASVVKVVELPGVPLGGDVSDWLDAGRTVEELLALTEAAPNFTSNHKEGALEVRLAREINAAKLQERAREESGDLPFLPLLGEDGFIVQGWAHILASYPKGGKTELVSSLSHEWGALGETVLYFTEEPESIWRARLRHKPPAWEHVTLVFALGMKPSDIRERIQAGQETVVVIDTIRNLLGFRDETDNSQIALDLIPLVTAARQSDKTAVFLHHTRKGGGEHGEGIAGGHAFLGVVDVALELRRDRQAERRRQVRGWGRIIPVPELVYEMAQDGSFLALGDPGAVALQAVKERAAGVLLEEWATTKEIGERLEEPKPSLEQLRQALESLAREGRAERKPSITEGRRQGVTYKWRVGNLTSNGSSFRLEVKSQSAVSPQPLVTQLAVPCPHRPPGEADDRWVHRDGRPAKEGSGHLVSLALDMGATLVEKNG
ncbi:MAG: AAA family ATPase [Dehalococcoidia bacterium]|nr:AAA family ATPase [Dehalococcoidia bacterium]